MLHRTIAASVLSLALCCANAFGFVAFDLTSGIQDGSRWNATSVVHNRGGNNYERSLAGGLRYSAQGGSYQAYRDQFAWTALPSVAAFQQAVDDAFAAWTVTDPATSLGTDLSFTPDFGTPVTTAIDNFVRLGSEIDLLAANIGTTQKGIAAFTSIGLGGGVTLTSGTTGYGGFAISGADITMNNNVVWSGLSDFQVILTHEIGHAIGLGDVEDPNELGFVDDNYTPANPLGTLTNSAALLVNTANPGASAGLAVFNVPNDVNGIDAPGVDILMESDIPQTFFNNPPASLQNDDFLGRQFLYPWVPEPSMAALMLLGGIAALRRRRA